MNAPSPVRKIVSVTIVGIGGAGKTSVALEFAHLSMYSKDAILWIRSETPAALSQSFTQAAQDLHLPGVSGLDHTSNRLILLDWLRITSISHMTFTTN